MEYVAVRLRVANVQLDHGCHGLHLASDLRRHQVRRQQGWQTRRGQVSG